MGRRAFKHPTLQPRPTAKGPVFPTPATIRRAGARKGPASLPASPSAATATMLATFARPLSPTTLSLIRGMLRSFGLESFKACAPRATQGPSKPRRTSKAKQAKTAGRLKRMSNGQRYCQEHGLLHPTWPDCPNCLLR